MKESEKLHPFERENGGGKGHIPARKPKKSNTLAYLIAIAVAIIVTILILNA